MTSARVLYANKEDLFWMRATTQRRQMHERLGSTKKWWPGAELNCRHEDFQSTALPTELPGRSGCPSFDGTTKREF